MFSIKEIECQRRYPILEEGKGDIVNVILIVHTRPGGARHDIRVLLLVPTFLEVAATTMK